MSFGPLLAAIGGRAPSPDIERAVALQVADALACLALARTTEEAEALARFYRDGGDAGLVAAAAAIIRLSEGDAIHVPSCLTPGAIVVPVALLTARDDAALVAAVRAATSVGLWIAEGVGGVAALERGVWPTLLAAPAMAATAAAVARGLDGDRLDHAVALAVSGSSGRLGRPSGALSGRWLAIGEAVLRGMRAADAAAAGFRGDTSLPGPAWLAAQGGAAADAASPDPDALMRIGLKPYMAARQGMNALAAFETLRPAFRADAIERVEVELPAECLPVVTRPLAEGDRLSRIANLAYRLATAAGEPGALLDPSGLPADGTEARRLAARVEVRAGAFPPEAGSWPARVRVHAAGRAHETECRRCPGDAGDLAGQAGVVATKIGRLPTRLSHRLRALPAAGEGSALLAGGREALRQILEPAVASTRVDAPVAMPSPAG